MADVINIIRQGLLDEVWNELAEVNTDDCSREEATEAIDRTCALLHEADPTRFPWETEDSEGEEL